MQNYLESRKPIVVCRDRPGSKHSTIEYDGNKPIVPKASFSLVNNHSLEPYSDRGMSPRWSSFNSASPPPVILPSMEWQSNRYLSTKEGYARLGDLSSDDNISMMRQPSITNSSTSSLNALSNYERFLNSRRPEILKETFTDQDCVILAPMNTNIDFNILDRRARYKRVAESYEQFDEKKDFVIPPLNTDIRFSTVLPYHKQVLLVNAPAFNEEHPHKPHVHHYNAKHFSWAITTDDDTPELKTKKKLIHPIANQWLCGSCWAISTATSISDCLVISGAVNWSPKISASYIMMCLPSKPELQQKCNGGNPAEVALALESVGVCDETCIDYSWCSSDKEICTSADAVRHFKSNLGETLNEQIPEPCGCYFKGERFSYMIDSGSDVFDIDTANGDIETFRNTVRAHILDFGPPVGGYIVLRNFTTGNFTDPNLNGGVYLDRADYSTAAIGQPIRFDDSFTQEVSGLHAVSIIGWGVAENIQYDTDKRGDVPYWHVMYGLCKRNYISCKWIL